MDGMKRFRPADGQGFVAAPRPGTARCKTDAPHPDSVVGKTDHHLHIAGDVIS